MFLSATCLSAVFSFFLVVSASSSHSSKRHAKLAHRMAAVNATASGAIEKRWPNSYTNARATWYDVGLGACGQTNVPSDYIVALNAPMYGNGYPGPMCFKEISITCNGKQANAQIMDECMICPQDGGIDMSKGLFQHFAGLGDGVISCDWHFLDGTGDDPAPPPPPPQTTSTHHTTSTSQKPTSTWSPPPPPTTTSHKTTSHSTTSSSSSTHSTTSTTHSTTSTTPTPTPTYSGPNNLQNVLNVVGNIAKAELKAAA